MSDLSEAEEKEIYDDLIKAYPFPKWVVVWRGDRRKGGSGVHSIKENQYWYHKTAPFDFEIYRHNREGHPNIYEDVPDDIDEDNAVDVLKDLRENDPHPIIIEAKKRDVSPTFSGLYINNHIDPTYAKYYPIDQETGEALQDYPPDNIPEAENGKLNKMIRAYNASPDRKVYFINKDKNTGTMFVIKFSQHLIDSLLPQGANIPYVANKSDTGRRWEKNYNIYWKHIGVLQHYPLFKNFDDGLPKYPGKKPTIPISDLGLKIEGINKDEDMYDASNDEWFAKRGTYLKDSQMEELLKTLGQKELNNMLVRSIEIAKANKYNVSGVESKKRKWYKYVDTDVSDKQMKDTLHSIMKDVDVNTKGLAKMRHNRIG